jgi:hypothetical protein
MDTKWVIKVYFFYSLNSEVFFRLIQHQMKENGNELLFDQRLFLA